MLPLKKTIDCNALSVDHVDQTVVLTGWVQKRRDHGGVIFIDLRDRSGLVQVAVNPENCSSEVFALAETVRSEYVLGVEGVVRRRPEGMENENLKTGDIDVMAINIVVYNASKTPPFYLTDDTDVEENKRLRYRYLDLRRPEMQKNIKMRHDLNKSVRNFLDQDGFWEVETPILMKSTPEGARDFLVPSRVNEGKFFALPQSPQQYKQLLMVAGVEKYFQIARCFRDEDLRADRQPEFTQLDIEMSFADEDDVMAMTEGLLQNIFKDVLGQTITVPFQRMTYADAMDQYGSDKPDVRFGMKLVNLSDIVEASDFKVFKQAITNGGVVKAINAKGFADLSRRHIDELTKYVGIYGAKGLAYFVMQEDGSIKSPIAKFLGEDICARICERMEAEAGDIIFFGADSKAIVADSLGHLRLRLAEERSLFDHNENAFLWVTEFPLLEWNEDEKRYTAVHHPFTAPHEEDMEIHSDSPGKIRSKAYDIVLNGVELGGGSVRIHDRNLQEKMFDLLGIPTEVFKVQFKTLLEAFEYGAPPHAGIALGLDRMLMLMAKRDTIRDVIAFPKTQSAVDLMVDAPSEISSKQLRELHIQVIEKKQSK